MQLLKFELIFSAKNTIDVSHGADNDVTFIEIKHFDQQPIFWRITGTLVLKQSSFSSDTFTATTLLNDKLGELVFSIQRSQIVLVFT